MFSISIVYKAEELGFIVEEIKSMSVDTGKITFVDVLDDLGNLLEGKHHASSLLLILIPIQRDHGVRSLMIREQM